MLSAKKASAAARDTKATGHPFSFGDHAERDNAVHHSGATGASTLHSVAKHRLEVPHTATHVSRDNVGSSTDTITEPPPTDAAASPKRRGLGASFALPALGRVLQRSKSQPELKAAMPGATKTAKLGGGRTSKRMGPASTHPPMPPPISPPLPSARADTLSLRSASPWLPSPATPTQDNFTKAPPSRPTLGGRSTYAQPSRPSLVERSSSPRQLGRALAALPANVSTDATKRTSSVCSHNSEIMPDHGHGHGHTLSASTSVTSATAWSQKSASIPSFKAVLDGDLMRQITGEAVATHQLIRGLAFAGELQAGWLQDDMLAALRDHAPTSTRSLQDVVLGAVPDEILPILSSTYALPKNLVTMLTNRRNYIFKSGDDFGTSSVTLECRMALLRLSRRVKDDSPAHLLERRQRSVARFVAALIDLESICAAMKFAMPPEVKARIDNESPALVLDEVHQVLNTLQLSAAQRACFGRYLERASQKEAHLPSQVALRTLLQRLEDVIS